MKVFVCYRSLDQIEGDKLIQNLLSESENSVAVLTETEHSDKWKINVEKKINESDFVIFLVGQETFKSEQIIWEYAKAKDLNKRIIGIKLNNASEESILFCQGFQVFNDTQQSLNFLIKAFDYDRQLKLEQYKIMVSSTEKVSEQRLKVNNLFFTITSSILSVGFVLGKTFGFTLISLLAVSSLTLLALLATYFWEKMINSYGQLNKGKFILIDKIEKSLRTNMFEEEWKILTQEIEYEPNTKTETTIVKRFRLFIVIILLIEIAYILYKLYQIYPICSC
ncbi:RipA family octameric membrane protein [Maribacter stanieri]|uniref:RipA family octameric membrane protein n=1 Tax=Maribacter stanieri TaxID=440514 RepID=UPI0030DAA7A0|tara:strand:+ start:526 stop:1365 length:840 start_codon:yes stop_codon:yes gene_type:complete